MGRKWDQWLGSYNLRIYLYRIFVDSGWMLFLKVPEVG